MKLYGFKEMVKLQEKIDSIKEKLTDQEYNEICMNILEVYNKKKEFILFNFKK